MKKILDSRFYSPPVHIDKRKPPGQGRVRSLVVGVQNVALFFRELAQGQHAFSVDERSTALERQCLGSNVVRLDPKGRPLFQSFKSSAVQDFLRKVLGDAGQTYQASHIGDSDQFLLDAKGHLLHLRQSADAFFLVRSSKPQWVAAGQLNHQHLECVQGAIQVLGDTKKSAPLEILSRADIGYLTGIHQDQQGKRFRLHEQRLYVFDELRGHWVESECTKDMMFTSLLAQGNGKVYGQVGGALVDLSTQRMTEVPMLGDVKEFSVSADQHIAALTGDKKQVLKLINLEQSDSVSTFSVHLEHPNGLAQANKIGLAQQHLFISDTEGRLYSVSRDQLQGDKLELKAQQYRYSNAAGLSENQRVVEFLSGNDGQFHVLVSDRGQVHSHGLHGDTPYISGGWNFSDVQVVDNRRGLPIRNVPNPSSILDLDLVGRICLTEQRIKYWDTASQDWKDTGIKDVEKLQLGLDGKAYLTQGGILKKLSVTRKPTRFLFGSSQILNQLPRSTISVSVGDDVAGLDGRIISAFAMLDDKQFVVLDNECRLTVHHKDGETTDLKFVKDRGNITSLSFDKYHNLYALTDLNRFLISLKVDWQSREKQDAQGLWTLFLPSDELVRRLISSADENLRAAFSARAQHVQMLLEHSTSQPLEANAGSKNLFELLSKRLRKNEKVFRLPVGGLTARANLSHVGRSTMQNANKVSTREFIRANIFKLTWEVPRPLKNTFYYIQHRYRGRNGLLSVYESEYLLYNRLQAIRQDQTPAVRGRDLKSRIADLEIGPQGVVLKQAMEAFRGELEDSSYRMLKQLGQQHGRSKLLQQKSGLLNIHGNNSEPSLRSQVSMKLSMFSQKPDVNSSGHDLLNTLKNTLTHIAPTGQNRAHDLLLSLQGQGMQLTHQKASVPLWRRRDRSDSLGLTKERLALDTLTLIDLVYLLDELESLSSSSASSDIKKMQMKFEVKRSDYQNNQIRKVTEMGFTDHKNLEACYDVMKAFTNGLKKPDHSINVNLRAATDSNTQAELVQAFKTILRNLKTDDEFSLQRNYGLNFSTTSIGFSEVKLGIIFSFGSLRGYSFNVERGEKGLTVSLQRDRSVPLSAGIAVGFDFFPVFFNGEAAHQLPNINLPNNRSFTPAFRVAPEVSGNLTITQRDAVVFTVPDTDIDDFVDNLFSGRLKPLEVMQMCTDHATQKSLRFNFDINATCPVDARLGFSLSEKGSSPFSAVIRAGLGGTVYVNLLNYSNYSVEQRNNQEQTQESSQNRPRLINSYGASGSAKAQISVTYSKQKKKSNTIGLPLSIGAGVGVDNKTSKRTKFTFKEAVPVTAKSLSDVKLALGAAFKDPDTQEFLDAQDQQGYEYLTAEDVGERLKRLNEYFANKVENNEHYAAFRALRRSEHQHKAAMWHYSVLESARFESAYTNLSRLDELGCVSAIMGLVNANHSPSNAQKVASLLKQDPTLNSFIKELKVSSGTLVKVRLELKDSVLDDIYVRSCLGQLSQQEVSALLSDRKNIRIKSIIVLQSVSKAEGLTSPVPVLTYSGSASLSLTRALGKIDFSYGMDEETPQTYTLEGELSNLSDSLSGIAAALKQEGFELNR